MVLRPEFDPQSGAPLYRQLYIYVRDLIRSGRLLKGERLPATRELAGALGLNRATITSAYELLESDALIESHVGRGSFVAGSPAPAAGLDWEQVLREAPLKTSVPAAPDDAISFATSRPSEDLFPLDDFRTTCQEVIAGPDVDVILQLGSPCGYPPLRHYLFEQSKSEGVAREHEDLLITSGCQQALDLIQRVLVRPGETVIVEDPVYPGLKSVFTRAGARLAGVPVGGGGIDVDAFGRALLREKPRLAVLTPNFQNPTGATMSLVARQAVVRLAREAGVVLVENDIYGALRYEGEPLPSLKQLDDSGGVVLLRSFSKIAFPGLRVGWVVAPRPLIVQLTEAKQWSDLHTDQLSQAVLLRFAETGRLEQHRRRMLAAGTGQLRAVLEACARELPAGSRFTRPQGGMNLWVRLPAPLDAGELLARAQAEKVTYLPGRYFAVSHAEPGALRLSFAGLAPDRIRAGMRLLGGVFRAELERSRSAPEMEPVSAIV